MNYVTALVQLPLVRETGKERIRSPEDVARICADLADLAQETFHVLMLNTRNCLVNRQIVTIGLVDASLIHAREVFRPAILENATTIVLAHNHPSGDHEPSEDDLVITNRLIEAGKIIGITVQDHVIISRKHKTSRGFFSMREHGLCGLAQEHEHGARLRS